MTCEKCGATMQRWGNGGPSYCDHGEGLFNSCPECEADHPEGIRWGCDRCDFEKVVVAQQGGKA